MEERRVFTSRLSKLVDDSEIHVMLLTYITCARCVSVELHRSNAFDDGFDGFIGRAQVPEHCWISCNDIITRFSQVLLLSQSLLIIKKLLNDDNIQLFIMQRGTLKLMASSRNENKSFVTSNEISFLAISYFAYLKLQTISFHNFHWRWS